MATDTKEPAFSRTAVMNLPNQLTLLRLVLAVVLFVLIPLEYYLASLIVFALAAGTDWLDGFLARRYGLVTTLGRILDPFADKFVICGTFIFLAAVPNAGLRACGMHAWVVVVVVGRELLITALRSFLEQQGADFSAAMSGKLKMVAQCAAAALSLYYLTYPASEAVPSWLTIALTVSVWSTVALTVFSGVSYVITAARVLRG